MKKRKSNHKIISSLKAFIMREDVADKYKSRPADFTRNRLLPFKLLVLFMLRKLYKSLALEIYEFFKELAQPQITLSKSAFTQARAKLSPLFFEDLLHVFNHEFYTDNDERVKLLKSMRILAVDGSTLDLPNHAELLAYYGVQKNQHLEYAKGRVSLLYDVLNGMILDGQLQPVSQGERKAALKHLQFARKGDLILYDRNYASFEMVHAHIQKGVDVLMRVRTNFSHKVMQFVQSSKQDDLVYIEPGKYISLKGKAFDRNDQIKVRLVRFNLGSGEPVVVLTTLTDAQLFPVAFLKKLYHLRWGIETQYDKLKNVLQVEHFSGYSHKAIQQDFYISIFLMNMQTLLTDELNQEIRQRYGHRKYTYKVNSALAIGHLKKQIVPLFCTQETQDILKELKEVFLQHVEPVRPKRKYPRETDKYRGRKMPLLKKNRKNVL